MNLNYLLYISERNVACIFQPLHCVHAFLQHKCELKGPTLTFNGGCSLFLLILFKSILSGLKHYDHLSSIRLGKSWDIPTTYVQLICLYLYTWEKAI